MSAERSTPQTRTRRDKGTENMIEATVRLLRQRGPEQVTVRDVAEASGHHHRFVQAWFGGKVGLFRAAFDRMTAEGAGQVGASFSGETPLGPDLRAMVTLMNWLVAAEPGSLDGPRPTPIIDQMIEIYQETFGLDREVARLMALRMVGASIAAVLFAGPLGLTPDDVDAVAQLEVELATLLAQGRSTTD
jgi:AcrR family transcriptional regulator